jgi:thiol-disulfide isomerase/thioredoxin
MKRSDSRVMWRPRSDLFSLGAILLGLCLGRTSAQADPLKVGSTFPDPARFKVEGNLPTALKGKVILVDFWASWCLPCKASFPAMEELQQRFGSQGLVILAVNVDEKRADMEKFVKKNPVTFAIVRDAEKKLVAAANIETMPTSFIIDREGKVYAVHSGYFGDETKRKYRQEIESLLKVSTP